MMHDVLRNSIEYNTSLAMVSHPILASLDFGSVYPRSCVRHSSPQAADIKIRCDRCGCLADRGIFPFAAVVFAFEGSAVRGSSRGAQLSIYTPGRKIMCGRGKKARGKA